MYGGRYYETRRPGWAGIGIVIIIAAGFFWLINAPPATPARKPGEHATGLAGLIQKQQAAAETPEPSKALTAAAGIFGAARAFLQSKAEARAEVTALPTAGAAPTAAPTPPPLAQGGGLAPQGLPIAKAGVVETQGYTAGSHLPTVTMGGIDLAVDGNGDGQAEPGATAGAPLVATIPGKIETYANTWPGGNCIKLINPEYMVKYCHMEAFAVTNGAEVQRGAVIGTTGSSGDASGPHLHYEIWHNGVNVNPEGYTK